MNSRPALAPRDLSAGWRVARLAVAGALAWGAAAAVRAQAGGTPFVWSTLAGGAASGAPRIDANGAGARFLEPRGIAVDLSGNVVVADTLNHSLRRVSATGAVTTLIGATAPGHEDGAAGVVRFNEPQGLAVDRAGNIFVADTANHVVRRVTPAGAVSTVAGRAGSAGFGDGAVGVGRLNGPRAVALDAAGTLYIADTGNHIVRKLDADGQMFTFAGAAVTAGAGDGTGSSARFTRPWGLAIDAVGNVFVADSGNATLRRITLAGGVTTLAGSAGATGAVDGAGSAARFALPTGLAIDPAGNLFVADAGNHALRRVTPEGVVTTVGGRAGVRGTADGLTGTALFSAPTAVALDAAGNLYVADTESHTIRAGLVPRAPAILSQPTGTTVSAGVGATFSVVASSLVPMTFQWSLNGAPIAGATAASYSVTSAQARDAGGYAVAIGNLAGATTSATAMLIVNAPPAIAVAPTGATVGVGSAGIGVASTAVLGVTAVGSNLSYQWLRDGVPVTGATTATLSTTVAGAYTVVVTNAFGSVASEPVRVEYPNRLVNLSTRGTVGSGAGALVAGLVVAAPAGTTKALLVRGIGPALRAFGVESAVPQTALTVTDASGATLASNQGWLNNSNLAQLDAVTRAVGAFGLQPSSGDSAVLVNLAGGVYTVSVAAAGSGTGAGLVEIYEASADTSRLVNLSTRGQVTATAGLTAGIVVHGVTPTRLLVRAIGPGLAQFGVTGALARPQLAVFSGTTQIAANAGWTVANNGSNPTTLAEAAAAAGAFPLAAGSDDAALLLPSLAPGNYTATVTGVAGATGVALIEVYQVP